MATLDMLPSTVYCPPPKSVPVHRRKESLNTIMEDEAVSSNEDASIEAEIVNWTSPMSDHFPTPRGNNFMPAPHFATWASPMSDNFPTPRGNHFMPAPQLPSEPSSAADSEFSRASVPWTRDSFGTQATDFDELYDASEDEGDYRRRSTLARASSIKKSTASNRLSGGSLTGRNSLPTLVIPPSPRNLTNPSPFKSFASPIPPTPPPKVPMSPAVFSYLAYQDVLSSSATPSLDGSLSSEQLAALSAPPTPNMGNDENDDGNGWGGVQLAPGAMATLHALSGGDNVYDQQTEQVIEVTPMSPTREMQQSPPPAISSIRRHQSVVLPPHQQRSLDSLSRLDIPSPGGFFSNLSDDTRSLWRFEPIVEADVPPSSTTAEHFYKTPWSTAAPSVASRPSLQAHSSDETITGVIVSSPQSTANEDIVATEILAKYDYDEGYVRKLSETASEHFDRTNLWLSAQTTYISALINPPEARDDEAALEKRDAEAAEKSLDKQSSPLRKTVRFSEFITNETKVAIGAPLPKAHRQESAYYRSFLSFITRSRYRDAFVHRLPRFEALQAQRIAFPEAHRNQLLGKYQLSVVPQSAKKRMSANVARGDETTMEDPSRIKADKEAEALAQMSGATWNVMAGKMLNGGRLISAPIAKRLARLTSMGPKANGGAVRERARILDLGGQSACDWAWHVAFEYPNVKVYTLTTKSVRQLSNSNIKGPRNHRQVAVSKLTRLPFPSNHFDLISARNLYSLLKTASEHGEDEYDACLAECLRVLKPGAYLEFHAIDAAIVNAGPLAQAKSVEFGYSLKTRGYDAHPTRTLVPRLRRAGFASVKRACLVLPMGAQPREECARDSWGVERKLELEARVSGSTEAAACVTGLVGAWAWEKWMLKLQMEMNVSEESLLEGNWRILEEGRKCGAGWNCLTGWARKPL